MSVSETPGLGVAGDIIHIYRVAVAAKRPTGMRQNNQWFAAKQPMVARQTTNGCAANDQRMCGKRPTDVRQTTNGVAAKQPTGLQRNNQRWRGKTTDGFVAKQPTGARQTTNGCATKRPTGAQYGWGIIDADVLPQPLRGNINNYTRYPVSPGFRWRSTPGYIPQPLRG